MEFEVVLSSLTTETEESHCYTHTNGNSVLHCNHSGDKAATLIGLTLTLP